MFSSLCLFSFLLLPEALSHSLLVRGALVAQILISKDSPSCSVSFSVFHGPSTPLVRLHLEEKRGERFGKNKESTPGWSWVLWHLWALNATSALGSVHFSLSGPGLCSQISTGLEVLLKRMAFPASVRLLWRHHSPWGSVHPFQTANAQGTLHGTIKKKSFPKHEAALPTSP